MNNSKSTIWNIRLPQYIGVLLLVASLSTIAWLTGNMVQLGSKAAIDDRPKNVQITNITDDSFVVSYTTEGKVLGSISYGTDNPVGAVALDERDFPTPVERRVHYIRIQNLQPATKYYFSITSGDETFTRDGTPYEVTTAPAIPIQPTTQEPLIGTVQLPGGGIPTEGLVYVTVANGQFISGLIKVDGSYTIPLSVIRKKDLSGPMTLSGTTPLLIMIEDASAKSNIRVLANQTNPVPLVTLSLDYNFELSTEPINTPTPASGSAEITPASFPTTVDTGPAEPRIIAPQAKQIYKDQQPFFRGKALPNADVAITIQTPIEIQTTVTADDNGNWEYRPSTPLDPGTHTLKIETVDTSGTVKTLSQTFTVNAQGSQFTEPSISPKLSPTQAPVTPTPTTAPTSTPTQAPSPTPTSVSPTPTSASIISSSPSAIITRPPVPQSGSSAMIFGVIATIILIGVGAFFIAL